MSTTAGVTTCTSVGTLPGTSAGTSAGGASAEPTCMQVATATCTVGTALATGRNSTGIGTGPAYAGLRPSTNSGIFWNAAGGCLWALTFGWLGATFGSQWSLIARWTGRVGVLILGLLVLVGVAVLLGRYRRGARADRHRAGPPSRAKVLSSVSHGVALA